MPIQGGPVLADAMPHAYPGSLSTVAGVLLKPGLQFPKFLPRESQQLESENT